MGRDKSASENSTRLETAAFKAQAEISKLLYDPSCNIFKPWQFENHFFSPVTLKTTYEELKILWNEEARFRPGFAASDDTITIPNLFAKVSGIHSSLCEYEKDVGHFLSSNKIFFLSGPRFCEKISEPAYLGYSKDGLAKPSASSSLVHFVSKNGVLDIERLVSSHFFENIAQKKQLQSTMARRLNQLLESDLLLKSHSEDTTLRVLHMLLGLDKTLVGMLENFDYPFDVPKIVIFIGNGAHISFEDCAAISLLYYCGFDILVLTPSGHADIENHINSFYFDIHSLQERNTEIDYEALKGNCSAPGKKTISHMAAFFKK